MVQKLRSMPPVRKNNNKVDWDAILSGMSQGKTTVEYGPTRNVFRQGEPADSLFYLRNGKVKLSVTDRKSTRLNSSHIQKSRMPSSA